MIPSCRSRLEAASDEAVRALDEDAPKISDLIDREIEAFKEADIDSSGDLDVHEYVLAIRFLFAEDDTVHIRSTFLEADLDASRKMNIPSSNLTESNGSTASTTATPSAKASTGESDRSHTRRRLNILQILFSRFGSVPPAPSI
eukprot:766751-Hanusia_phi.AAC.16